MAPPLPRWSRVRRPPKPDILRAGPPLQTVKLVLPVHRQVVVVAAHHPGVAERHHPLIDVQPLILGRMFDIKRCEHSSVIVLSVLLDVNPLPADQLDEAMFRDVAPVLAVLRAVDGIEPDSEFAPAPHGDHGVAVHDIPNGRPRKGMYLRADGGRVQSLSRRLDLAFGMSLPDRGTAPSRAR